MITKPMKAPSNSVPIEQVQFPIMGSPKMDGLRAYHSSEEGTVVSKTGKLFPNLYVNQLFMSGKALKGFDGEMVVGAPTGEDVIRRSMSGITSIQGEPDVTWYVFDDFTMPKSTFTARNMMAKKRIACLPDNLRKRIKFVEHKMLHSMEELLAYETEKLELGFEGLMLRSPTGPYKEGVSTMKEGWLLKFKRFVESEFLITGVEEGSNNTNPKINGKRSTNAAGMVPSGQIGALLGKDILTGEPVRVAAGRLTRDERVYYFRRPQEIKGRLATYRHFPTGTMNAPRFPTFQTFKHASTL